MVEKAIVFKMNSALCRKTIAPIFVKFYTSVCYHHPLSKKVYAPINTHSPKLVLSQVANMFLLKYCYISIQPWMSYSYMPTSDCSVVVSM